MGEPLLPTPDTQNARNGANRRQAEKGHHALSLHHWADPTYLSLFSGVGGLDLAVESFGYRCIGQVEIDEWCRTQLGRHWPDVPRWGDVAEVDGASYARYTERSGRWVASGLGEGSPLALAPPLGRPDVICGGFPCQPVSHAGKRKGRSDARWLWPEFARLVGELRPRTVVVENVPGLLSIDGGRAVSEVVGDLASMGYVGRHGTVRASDVGAPHRRERFFLIAYSDSETRGPAGRRRRSGTRTRSGRTTWTTSC